jgi:hypothetical protein
MYSSSQRPFLDSRAQRDIGQRLRAMYNDIIAQGIPSSFADLLKRLDEQDGKGHT